jgi:hypothetical protein
VIDARRRGMAPTSAATVGAVDVVGAVGIDVDAVGAIDAVDAVQAVDALDVDGLDVGLSRIGGQGHSEGTAQGEEEGGKDALRGDGLLL